MHSFFQSLHFRLIALILLASLPMAGLIFYNDLEERDHARRDAEKETMRLVRIMVAEYERVLSDAAQFVLGLGNHSQFWFRSPADCNARFAGLIGENPQYSGIALTDPAGNIVCSHPSSPSTRLTEVAVVEAALAARGVVVSDYVVGSLSGTRIVIVAAPVFDVQREIAGVLALGIDLSWTDNLARMVDLTPGSSFFIIDRNGVVLAVGPGPGEFIGASIAGAPVVVAARTARSEGFMVTSGLDGVERLFAFAPILEPDWASGYVFIGIPTSAAYAQADLELVRSLAGLGIATLFILAFARVAAMKLILSPVWRLNRTIERLKAGDLSARTGLGDRGDEISRLARTFDELAASLETSNRNLSAAYDRTLEGWSRALDLRDHETEGHSERVAELTLRLAEALGIGSTDLQHIRRGALLHDIGKIGIPDAILNKPGPLTEAEWEVMRRHPVIAHEFLREIDFLWPALAIPRWHHERWDGSGYPDGLAGKAIPLEARIFSVADVWDALRSDRPYRAAWPDERAIAYIRDQSGAYFDPEVVDVFLDLVAPRIVVLEAAELVS